MHVTRHPAGKHRPRLTATQRITRRALTRLTIAAVLLATLVALLGTAPAALVGLAWIVAIWLLPVAITRSLVRAVGR